MKLLFFAIILIPIISCSVPENISMIQCYNGTKLVYQSQGIVKHNEDGYYFEDTIHHKIIETNLPCFITEV